MRRIGRRTLLIAGAALLGAWRVPLAQRPQRIPRIGFMSSASSRRRSEAFLIGLRELGYSDMQNVRVEMRSADGQPDRIAALVDELVRREVDVLVVGSTIGARAAKAATTTIPVVFAGSSDPVAGGLVANLARPGGNVTGVSLGYGGGVPGKWIELLRELVADATRIAVLWTATNPAAAQFVDEVEATARKLTVAIERHHAAAPADLDGALRRIAGSRAQGLVVMPSPFWVAQRDALVAFAAKQRLPAMYFDEEFVEAGGLVSYGPSIAEAYRLAASYVDRILKGAKPGDLPVEQLNKYELVVHRGTAKALGLVVPQSIALRARMID
jgi:putative ABC transport system substrate-binding protein